MNKYHVNERRSGGSDLLADFRAELIGATEETTDRMRHAVLNRALYQGNGAATGLGGRAYARPTRRLVLAATALAVVAGAAGVAHTFAAPTPAPNGSFATGSQPGAKSETGAESSAVLVPVAYQFESDASPAGPHLRALADKLADAAYENHTGRYAYHHTKSWGGFRMVSPGDRYIASFVGETKVWRAADGTGKQVQTEIGAQFPDQESERYWQSQWKDQKPAAGKSWPTPGTSETFSLRPEEAIPPLPSDRAGLREMLKVKFGAGAVSKEVDTVYGRYAVPRQTRAEILRVLADVPGFVWRGEVTDRAGRKGVAITFDDREHDAQLLLVFNPNTGELLAHELVTLSRVKLSAYNLILGTDRTDQLG